MIRGKLSLAVAAGAILCAAFAYADGTKNAQLQAVDLNQVQRATPKRIMKVRWENGRIIPLTPWIEVGDFAPAGPCDNTGAAETLVFSHAPVNANTGAFDSSVQVCIAGSIFWFGPTYHNPYYANDIASLSDASFNGANVNSLTHFWGWNPNLDNNTDDNSDSQNCVIAILAVEDFDAECADVHEQSAGAGVIIDYGSLTEGVWYSFECLEGFEFALPSTPADDGTPGTELLGGYVVLYGQAFDGTTFTFATGAQPMLWHNALNNPQVGDSTSVQFDDDNPTDGDHDPTLECYDYTFDLSSFGCPNPSILGGAIAFWVESAGCVPSGGDVDGNGCVDDADLLAVLFAFGGSGGAEDVNCDGVVDDADLLEVLFNFGSGC